MRTLDELLAVSLWTRDLTPEQMERVKSSITVRDFDAGAYVARQGEQSDRWIGIVEGLIKLTLVDRSGKAATLLGLPQGSWFGEGSILKREQRRYDVVALRECRIAFMPETT